jgi:ceramide glucosyltransferase
MTILTHFFLALTTAALAYHLLSVYLLRRFLQRPLPFLTSRDRPGITLLKPVKGVDRDTEAALRSFIQQDYAPLQVLFGVADSQDPVIPLLQKLQEANPQVEIEVILCPHALGINPKVSTLRQLLPYARFDYLLISDSDVRVNSFYLATVAAALQEPGVGLVTCLYRAGAVQSQGAALEALTIAADFIPSVAMAFYVEGIRFALGATMALSRRVLEGIGGLEELADYLADDYQLGFKVSRAGYRICLLPYVAETLNGQETLEGYLAHQLRWARTYRVCRPQGYFAFGITHLFPFACLTWLVSGLSGWSGGLVLGVYFLRVLLGYIDAVVLLGSDLSWPYMLLIPPKDLVAFALWLLSFLGDRVIWKGEEYRVTPEGKLVKIMTGDGGRETEDRGPGTKA